MRVIAGSARGRKLANVAGDAVRPTADRVKEALFSMLGSRFSLEGARVLDLYAGSGGLGIEALSRGAADAVFVERHVATARVVQRNIEACGFRARVVVAPAQRALAQLEAEGARFDLVLIDPPYASGEAKASLERLAAGSLLAAEAWLVVEHDASTQLPETCGRLGLILTRRYGNTLVSVYGGDD